MRNWARDALPPYIKRESTEKDKEDYQTVYADSESCRLSRSSDSRTSFHKRALKKIEDKGVKIVYLTLHIGLGTFRLVEVEDLSKHRMDWNIMICQKESADIINASIAKRKKVSSRGTSVARVLETNVITNRQVRWGKGWTDRFIHRRSH